MNLRSVASELIPEVYAKGVSRNVSLSLGYYRLSDDNWLLVNLNSPDGVIYTRQGNYVAFVQNALHTLRGLKPQHIAF